MILSTGFLALSLVLSVQGMALLMLAVEASSLFYAQRLLRHVPQRASLVPLGRPYRTGPAAHCSLSWMTFNRTSSMEVNAVKRSVMMFVEVLCTHYFLRFTSLYVLPFTMLSDFLVPKGTEFHPHNCCSPTQVAHRVFGGADGSIVTFSDVELAFHANNGIGNLLELFLQVSSKLTISSRR